MKQFFSYQMNFITSTPKCRKMIHSTEGNVRDVAGNIGHC